MPSPFTLLQGLAALALAARLSRGRDRRPPLAEGAPSIDDTVSVVVPARDEEQRIAGCLVPLRDEPVHEVIVVDDESSDDTAERARGLGATVVEGAALPEGWAGKAWALEQGLRAASGDWVVFLDADARPKPGLIRALVAEAVRHDLMSAGPTYVVESAGERILHPAMLATIVYRYGPTDIPRPRRILVNGQCVVARREALLRAGGWGLAGSSLVEDVALGRALADRGWRIGFVAAGRLLEVKMYDSARETWDGWGRSLLAAEGQSRAWTLADLAVVWLTLALPLPRVLLRRASWLDRALVALRLALHAELRRGYRPLGVPFWLAPVADVPVAAKLTWSAVRPSRTWKGRTYA